jgi:hypothetical protein
MDRNSGVTELLCHASADSSGENLVDGGQVRLGRKSGKVPGGYQRCISMATATTTARR